MDSQAREEWIEVRHADGVVRRTWRPSLRAEVLPAALEAFRAEPALLCELVLTAIESGLAPDVAVAAEHLAKIDSDRLRRSWLPALVSCRCGRFKRAEDAIRRGRDLFGDCADFRYVDAEILFARQLKAKGEAALAGALDADPNHSRALRLASAHFLNFGGEEARERELERISNRAGAWRAKLMLSAVRFERGERESARRLALEAGAMEPDDAILGPLSALLARHHDFAGLIDYVHPRYDAERHGARCGVNLLFALLDAGRREEGEALIGLIRAAHPAAMTEHLRFYAGAFATMSSEAKEEPGGGGALRRALGSLARHDTAAHRRAVASRLLDAALLLPLSDPVADVPLLDLGIAEPIEPALAPVCAIDSNGRRVALAFTGTKPLSAWNARHRHDVELDGRSLLALGRASAQAALVLDPAGPASIELSAAQIDALLEREGLVEDLEQAAFLLEPLRAALPEELGRAAARIAGEVVVIREMFLFEMVSDRTGARPAVGIRFGDGAEVRMKREIVIEAGEALVLSRGRRRIQLVVVEVSDGAVLDWLRAHGERVRPEPGV